MSAPRSNLPGARWLISAIPNPFENGNLIEQARAANPDLEIIARAHTDAEVDYLKKLGASLIIMGEREIARGMTEHIIRHLDPSDASRAEEDAVRLPRSDGDLANPIGPAPHA